MQRLRSMNFKGRAMELSDLSVFHNRILTPDDKTGLVSEIKDNKMIPWVFLNSGPGNTTSPFKCEWMTIKNDVLYAGGHGTEFRSIQGEVVHRNNMWIKTIAPSGKLATIMVKLRNAVGIFEPGYLTHEAVQWSEIRKHWYFLPRKESKTVYVEEEDETNKGEDTDGGTNSWKPGSLTLRFKRSKEVTDEPVETYVTVFTTDGQVLLDDQKLDGNYKFEGLYFI
ncbi:Apyrase [Ostertagia ostertagi]